MARKIIGNLKFQKPNEDGFDANEFAALMEKAYTDVEKKMGIMIRSKWRKKCKSLEEYYDKNFDPKYYDFKAWEREIDPDEQFEDVEKYEPVVL